MFKSPWFTLILGLIVGLAVGYVLAERQSVPPARAAASGSSSALPEGHPPMPGGDGTEIARRQQLRQKAAELEGLLAQTPDDSRLMVALGNLYYDAAEWPSAKQWYSRALALKDDDADVITDYGIVLRNLGEFENALATLERAAQVDPDHWQAVYNQVVILNFDLHRHDEAAELFKKLKAMAAGNSEIPDLAELEQRVMETHSHE